ncbi:GNAT family N-acetyltransferase [Streptomyces sp. WI04-05B]|nr:MULTISPECIES: GNAT family N-acetyltransferase [unclassified Streptomyces]MDX2545217.1 GNAT family N-acetyltransferase [Streptomyces sp. WI04-05B]MDX2587331.1 GNAT family N-acetyltransferase [Streptomyces sp. WI04-05A]MDX3750938.1 GNAT family N-acetyltransferase [Streptomyces sp. AK08-02]
MSDVDADVDEVALEDWRYVHNVIVPPAAMSSADVRARSGRNRLEVAYLGDTLVGCSTVRPPVADGGGGGDAAVATVIARVLPGFRRRGFGAEMYLRGLGQARELGAEVIETVVLAANEDGLSFALRHGFEEVERYVLDGESDLWVDLRLAATAP